MILRLTLCLTLAACSPVPQVIWPTGPTGAIPALLPMDSLTATASTADARGAALAAEAAALRARAAAIGR